MRLIEFLKYNLFVRSLYSIYLQYFSFSKRSFGYIGKKVLITPPLRLSNPRNIYLYDNTYLSDATIGATHAKFILKKGAGAAGGLHIHTGNHAMIVGCFHALITDDDKPEGYDKDIVVEEDVWMGCNVTLLSGVVIGRGSIVAAGAVVNKNMPPYSVIGGVPARFIKFKWTIDQILKHEEILYPEQERFSRKQLEEIFKQYNNNKIIHG